MMTIKLLVLLSLTFAEANHLYCNIFSYEFEGAANECIKIHKAVKKALRSNDINKYILDEAFSPNSHHRPPTAIVIHYKVQVMGKDLKTERINSLPLPNQGPRDVPRPDKNDFSTCEGEEKNCTISVGWSSASIYTFIRPGFILSLQPAWFLCSLRFSVREHFGFSREVTLHINLPKDGLPVDTTIGDFKHSLEQVTAKMKTSKGVTTYLWKPISKADPEAFIEIAYTGIVLVLMLVSVILVLFFIYILLPLYKRDDLYGQYPSVWIGLALQWFGSIALEIYHTEETYDNGLYGNMRIAMLITHLTLDVICMISVFVYEHGSELKPPSEAAYCAMIITFGWALLRQLISLFFFMAVYPIEIISTVGIVAFGIIIGFLWSYLGKKLCEIVQRGKHKKIFKQYLTYVLITFVYFSINVIAYLVIVLYITFLNSLQNLPFSLVLKIIFAFSPPLLAALFTRILKKCPWNPREGYQPLVNKCLHQVMKLVVITIISTLQ